MRVPLSHCPTLDTLPLGHVHKIYMLMKLCSVCYLPDKHPHTLIDLLGRGPSSQSKILGPSTQSKNIGLFNAIQNVGSFNAIQNIGPFNAIQHNGPLNEIPNFGPLISIQNIGPKAKAVGPLKPKNMGSKPPSLRELWLWVYMGTKS